MWFNAICWLILGIFGAWVLPEPFNFMSGTIGIFFCCYVLVTYMPEEPLPPMAPPLDLTKSWEERFYKSWGAPSCPITPNAKRLLHKQSDKAVDEIGRPARESEFEPLGSLEKQIMAITFKTQGDHRQCMRCAAWVIGGLKLERGADTFFFCFGCDTSVTDKELLIRMARNKYAAMTKDDETFDINMHERLALLLDAIVAHFDVTKLNELELEKYCASYMIVGTDLLDLKRKVHVWAEALRSSRPKVAASAEEASDEKRYSEAWYGM